MTPNNRARTIAGAPGGHAIAIYEVSKNTTRDHIGPQLCEVSTGYWPPSFTHAERGRARLRLDRRTLPPLMTSPMARAMSSSSRPLRTPPVRPTGRYLVICMNRTHLLNDWMFGFVNVVGDN